MAGKTIKLKLRWPDFTTLTRQTTLNSATDQEQEIEKAALDLLRSVRKPNQAVRLIGVGVTGLGQPIRQLGLWDTSEPLQAKHTRGAQPGQPRVHLAGVLRMDSEKERKLQEALDELQEKYGRNAIHKGKM